nr:hypothetical protein [Chromobacterium sp. ASV5]
MQQSPLDRATVREIFRVLRGSFGNRFLENYKTGELVEEGVNKGHDVGVLEAMDVWGHKLRHLSPADVRHGLEATFKYPPSADEFIAVCCSRDITPPSPQPDPEQQRLAGPKMTRKEAETKLRSIGAAVKTVDTGAGNRMQTGWAEKIADEVERGVYRGGAYAVRMAAEALATARKPVPAALQSYLPKSNSMEDAA